MILLFLLLCRTVPNKTTPLTFEIDMDVFTALEEFKDRTNSKSTSAIIREAIERYDLEDVAAEFKESKQVSLRLEKETRDRLKLVAKSQGISVGFIIRECIMNFIAEDQVTPQPRAGKTRTMTVEKPDQEEAINPWQI